MRNRFIGWIGVLTSVLAFSSSAMAQNAQQRAAAPDKTAALSLDPHDLSGVWQLAPGGGKAAFLAAA